MKISEDEFRQQIDGTKRIDQKCLFGSQKSAIYWNNYEYPKYCKTCGGTNITLQIHPIEARNFFYCRDCDKVIDESFMMKLHDSLVSRLKGY